MFTDQRFLNRSANRRLQSNRKNLILFTLILAIIGIAYLLVGAFGTMVVEENIDSAGEYEAWKGSFWDWTFDWFVTVGFVYLAGSIVISLVFIRR